MLRPVLVSIAATFVASLTVVSAPTHAVPVGTTPFVGEDFQGRPCHGRKENYGPFDYLERANLPNELGVVERHHFNSDVEHLIRGQTSPTPMGDISYTLYAWPNHHRALYSAIRFRMQGYPEYRVPDNRKIPTAECFLQRAIQFSPRDATTYMLYGILLQRTKQPEKALQQYRLAHSINSKDTQIIYNMALVLIELGKLDEAQKLADQVYATDFPLKGLKKRLDQALAAQNTDSTATTEEKQAKPKTPPNKKIKDLFSQSQ